MLDRLYYYIIYLYFQKNSEKIHIYDEIDIFKNIKFLNEIYDVITLFLYLFSDSKY